MGSGHMTAPFANDYQLRLVATSDARACATCFKPSTLVLVNTNKADFFYVCPGHLQDVNYASPKVPEEYNELVKEKAKLTADLALCRAELEKVKPYVWTKYTKMWGSKGEKKETGEEDESAALEAKIEAGNKRMDELTRTIADFKFKNYTLHKDVYKIRINKHLQAKAKVQRQAQLAQPGFFPSVPTGAPSGAQGTSEAKQP